jgi:hypothetical protein
MLAMLDTTINTALSNTPQSCPEKNIEKRLYILKMHMVYCHFFSIPGNYGAQLPIRVDNQEFLW